MDTIATNEIELHERTVRRVFAAYAAGDDAALRGLLAPGFVAHSLPPGLAPDATGFLQVAAVMHAGLHECRYEIDDLVAAGDRVAARFTVRAVHGGELFGIPPSGRAVTMTGMEFYRLAEGRGAELWGEYDTSGVAAG